MPEGKYFVCKSRLPGGLVLDLAGEGTEAGTQVVISEHGGGDSQYWYECAVSGTIRNKHSNLCLDVDDDGILITGKYVEDKKSQEWAVAMDRIQNKHDQNQVLQVTDANTEPGSGLSAAEFTNAANQLWDFAYKDMDYFYMASKLHGKVLTIKEAKKTPGAKVVMWDKKEGPADDQLWFEDKLAIIRSKLNNFVLECEKAELGEIIKMEPFNPGETKQLWTRFGDCIVSRVHPKQVISIRKKNKDNGAKVVVGQFKDEANTGQHWNFEHISL